MQSERKLEILSAERRFAVNSRLAAALAERGFYLLGSVNPGDRLPEAELRSMSATDLPSLHALSVIAADERI